MAYESPLTIAEVVKDISANKYVLPSIQREFVWSTSQIEKLFDSVILPDAEYCFFGCSHAGSNNFCKCDIVAAFQGHPYTAEHQLLQGEIGGTG